MWARGVLGRAISLPEIPDLMWSPASVIPSHYVYVARGLAADIREGTAAAASVHDLLRLVAHPLDDVSLVALEEICKFWRNDPKLTWAGLLLALSLCHLPPRSHDQIYGDSEVLHTPSEAQVAIDMALEFYESEGEWAALPLPPPAWVKVESGGDLDWHQSYEEYDAIDSKEKWGEPEVTWCSTKAANILERIPYDGILNSSAKNALLDFFAGVLDWTNQKNSPPLVRSGRRDRLSTDLFEWAHTLGSRLGHVAGFVSLSNFQPRFLNLILELEDENCWALLAPFTSTYICTYVYDAPVVPDDAVALISLCLERFLKDPVFKRDTYRSGELSGFYQPKLVRTLMFVEVEHADQAARYANGDWSEIRIVFPIIDRFVHAGGWAASIMHPFLTLCERAKATYPAEEFADQVLSIISGGPENLKGWHGTFIPARIAELVQHFAHRDTPMELVLAQKFLRILDMLVDMGDRRSAALQLSEAFREICLPS